ncbi:hypothetical protein [Hungatella effluvii]
MNFQTRSGTKAYTEPDLQTKRNGRHLPFLFVCITVCIL